MTQIGQTQARFPGDLPVNVPVPAVLELAIYARNSQRISRKRGLPRPSRWTMRLAKSVMGARTTFNLVFAITSCVKNACGAKSKMDMPLGHPFR